MEIQKEKVMKYDFAAIEKKWQANWEKTKPYAAVTGADKQACIEELCNYLGVPSNF